MRPSHGVNGHIHSFGYCVDVVLALHSLFCFCSELLAKLFKAYTVLDKRTCLIESQIVWNIDLAETANDVAIVRVVDFAAHSTRYGLGIEGPADSVASVGETSQRVAHRDKQCIAHLNVLSLGTLYHSLAGRELACKLVGAVADILFSIVARSDDLLSQCNAVFHLGRGLAGHLNDEVEIIGVKEETQKTVVTGIEMFRKLLDEAQAGDNIGALLRGINRDEVEKGQVLAKPGTVTLAIALSRRCAACSGVRVML